MRPARAALLVVDCPDGGTLASAASVHPALLPPSRATIPIAAAIHLTPAAVAASPAYQAWAAALVGDRGRPGPSILASVPPPGAPPLSWVGHVSAATTLARLSTVDGRVWPGGEGGGEGEAASAPPLTPPLLPGRLMLRLRGGPPGGAATVDASDCLPPFNAAAVRAATRAGLAAAGVRLPEAAGAAGAPAAKRARRRAPPAAPPSTNQAAAAALRARLAGRKVGGGGHVAPEAAAAEDEEDEEEEEGEPHPAAPPTLTFLGTGSAEPSAHRGASALFLRPAGGHAASTAAGLLLDAGEGTAGALARAAGPGALTHLAAAWCSHRHADHCLGLAGVVAARAAGRAAAGLPPTPLPIIGPHAVRRWLADLAAAGALPRHAFTFTHAAGRPPAPTLAALALAAWTPAPAIHCADSHALVLDGAAGWRLAVSGDSVPCPGFAAAAAGADLLVHEATFGAGREGDAASKKHATVAGALGLAASAAARRTVLTHFSQRYPGPPPDAVADAGAWEAAGAVAAVDGMVVELRGRGAEALPGVGRRGVDALVALHAGGKEEGEGEGEEGGAAAYDSS